MFAVITIFSPSLYDPVAVVVVNDETVGATVSTVIVTPVVGGVILVVETRFSASSSIFTLNPKDPLASDVFKGGIVYTSSNAASPSPSSVTYVTDGFPVAPVPLLLIVPPPNVTLGHVTVISCISLPPVSVGYI